KPSGSRWPRRPATVASRPSNSSAVTTPKRWSGPPSSAARTRWTWPAEPGPPSACIPAGTRNHFALDLGVDRDDVVGALDAFVDGGQRWVDLGEVNGRTFVNNVSLGLYGESVQRAGDR